VTDHGEQLREAFESHEHQTPDPAAVYARVQELSVSYRRRRRGFQTAGGAALGVGLIAGAMNLPMLLPDKPATNDPAAFAPAAASPFASPRALPSFSAPPPAATASSAVSDEAPPQTLEEKRWEAYFAAGYTYDEAVRLQKLWKMKGDIGDVKAEAGRRLLAGKKLPIKPSPAGIVDARQAARIDAFFAAGYDYDDAVTLSKLWKTDDAFQAKIEGGKRLLAGRKLPIAATPEDNNPEPDAGESTAVNAFFDAGYDYDDAVTLEKLWKTEDPYQAKIKAGKLLIAGKELPIRP
jgi:hypothetical protein